MHGLINRGIECFLRDTYGDPVWDHVVQAAELGMPRFEAMMHYDDSLTKAILEAASARIAVPAEMLLEDLGTYLVANPNTEAIRRLMRFGGATFEDYLHSMEDLPDRVRLAVPDLMLPAIDLVEETPGDFCLRIAGGLPGFALVLVGMLRSMADDYGALALVEAADAVDPVGSQGEGADGSGAGEIRVRLLDRAFAEGRRFDLSLAGR